LGNVKYNTHKIIVSIVWAVLAVTVCTLLFAGMSSKNNKICTGVDITIEGATSNFFVDEAEVRRIVRQFGVDTGISTKIGDIDIKAIERALYKNVWVKHAQIYFDNNGKLHVILNEREPVARVFRKDGSSFYLDSSAAIMPLSTKFSARVPIFATNSVAYDSATLQSIKNISNRIVKDSFLNALIEQAVVTKKDNYEFVPKMGKQRIVFGNSENIDAKFDKLKLFYKNIISEVGWNKYATINLAYNNQVVATVPGREEFVADSMRTVDLLTLIANNASMRSADSMRSFAADNARANVDSSLIETSTEREEEIVSENAGQVVLPKLPVATAAPVMVKPNATLPNKPKEQAKPKVVMPVKKEEVKKQEQRKPPPKPPPIKKQEVKPKTAEKPPVKNNKK
jgi:cell division protein FtsQ